MAQSFWQMPLSQVEQTLNSTISGLKNAEVERRVQQYGPNVPHTTKRRSPFLIFISQFNSPLIIILIGVSLISFYAGEFLDGSIILGMLVINAIIGFFQENKAEKSLEKLFQLIQFHAHVLRDNKLVTRDRRDLVPGDVVILNAGDIVPADIRILEARNVTVNEAVLTGESAHIEKTAAAEGAPDDIPQNIKNGLFMGTSLATGYVKGIVIYTGTETVLGRSVAPATTQASRTNFEKNLLGFTQLLLRFVIVLSVVITVVNTYLGRGLITSLLLAITLAIGITPEVLPIVVTITISAAAYNLAKKHVIVRRLTALEDLGNIDILCSDKTGTITTGELQVLTYSTLDTEKKAELLLKALICNSSNPQTQHQMMENPLDEALYAYGKGQKVGDVLYKDFRDFDFTTKTMSVLITETSLGEMQITKGASEAVIAQCTRIETAQGIQVLTTNLQEKLRKTIAEYEAKGYRVISVAYAPAEKALHIVKDLSLIYGGYIVFEDPPRHAIKYDITKLRELNIGLKIITGDSPVVTQEICTKVGLEVLGGTVVLGADLETMDDKQLFETIKNHNVFARVTPEQKKIIMTTLQKEGHVVAYMGDGINDVGALTTADVGISVDSAVPVAKDASDVIMLRKDVSALLVGVKEGRRTFGNTIKFIINTMSSSFGNVITIAVSSCFLKFLPLLPSQLLLNDTISDLQHLVTSTDNVDIEMLRKPRNWDETYLIRFMIVFGLISTVFDFILMGIFLTVGDSPAMFRTLWFIESSISELIATFSVRTIHAFWKTRPSMTLVLVSLFTIALTIIIPYTSVGTSLFGFTHIHLHDLALILGIVGTYFVILELVKQVFYRHIYNPYKDIEVKPTVLPEPAPLA